MFAKTCPLGRSRGAVVVQARFGRDSGLILGPGGNSGPGGSNPGRGGRGEPRLILPGQQGPGRGAQRLLTPDKNTAGRTGSNDYLPDENTLGLVGESQQLMNGPPTLNKFRPPAGFMNETLPDDSTSSMQPQEMLNRLGARAGQWHELAKLVPALNSKGFPSTAIDEITGITPLEQNMWVVAATVYESVKASPEVPPEVLARFSGNGGAELLHPFRFLSAERRVAAAHYIVRHNLDEPMCEVLARSMKEYERRPSERAGFSEHPGDCLAFKYLRDAIECGRRREEALTKLDQGLAVAVTEGARERLMELVESNSADADGGGAALGSVAASLITLRLSPDELTVRPVAVVGELGSAQAEDIAAAPRTSQGGAFGSFRIEVTAAAGGASGPRSWEWVALPQWRALSMARHPVALTLRDCAAVPAVLAGSKAKTDEDRRRLSGAGMLVADRDPATFAEVQPDAWYLAAAERGGGVVLVEGRRAGAYTARGGLLAAVLFLARPPVKEAVDKGTNLLQL